MPEPNARRDGDAGRLGRPVGPPAEQGREPGGDLPGRALPPSRADSQRRGDDLHRAHPGPDGFGVVVKSVDRRVGAVPFGLWGQSKDDESGQQPPESRREWDGPRAAETSGTGGTTFTDRRWHVVATDHSQSK